MLTPPETLDPEPLKVGSLFSGYGGLDLAVEHVFGARTAWFSEINEPVAHVFSHHWPDAPNLGDITMIDWRTVEPVTRQLAGKITYHEGVAADDSGNYAAGAEAARTTAAELREASGILDQAETALGLASEAASRIAWQEASEQLPWGGS